jgi:uncharacterized Zn finger protein (UPF0148 family)
MSDFDKEAEREKLREKFERDKQKRKQSERMSELLLKGATMTNKHHDCGSPVFRWQGEEFCPSCEAPVGADEAVEDQEAAGEADTAGREETGVVEEAAEESPETGVDAATDGKSADEVVASGSATTEIDVTPEPTASTPGEDGVGEGTEETPTAEPAPTPKPARDATDTGAATGTAVADARASLERTLADVARQAEETSTADLTHKRNLIAAAREAAEALEATRRAGRQ